jgi:hypothetical protein
MTIPDATLTLDLGTISWKGMQHPFVVTLDAQPLELLVVHASQAHRVYELALVDRPGDAWAYVQVAPKHLPPRISERLEAARREPGRQGASPGSKVAFVDFDGLFHRGEEAEPEDEAWEEARNGDALRSYVQRLAAGLSDARSKLGAGSALIRHELSRIVAGTHPFAFLDRHDAIAASRRLPPNEPRHTGAFYAKLGELLGDDEIGSVSCRGDGDHRVLRMLCEAQRLRAEATGVPAAQALEISAFTRQEVNGEEWGADITYLSEDAGQGFLFIEGTNPQGKSIRDLVESYASLGPGGYILSCKDEGPIAGYQVESGEGWYLYRSEVTPRMLPALRKYHSVWALMLAQENEEISDTQVVEIIAQWENLLSRRFPGADG